MPFLCDLVLLYLGVCVAGGEELEQGSLLRGGEE
jgi:hypothetical protein